MRLSRIFYGTILIWMLTICFPMGASAAKKKTPGQNELLILDPGVDEKGLPKVIVSGDRQVEIPPSVHVHRYYYTGKKEYQAPLIRGGPTIIVVQHPRTAERLYIDANLPAGAPTIAYTKTSITYIYSKQRVVIQFSKLNRQKVNVHYLSGHGLKRGLASTSRKIVSGLKKAHSQSKLMHSVHDAVSSRKDVVVGAVGVVETTAKTILDKANQALGILPGVQFLESLGKQAEERLATEELKQAGLKQAKKLEKFIPTIR